MNSKISEVLERFYICTNLPVIAIDTEGDILSSSGLIEYYKDIMDENKIIDKVMDWIQKEHKGHVLSISCDNKNYYTACYMDPKNVHRGIFILGPHSCVKNNEFCIPYKPKCYMEDLISFLYSINRELNGRKYPKKLYSYHIRKALDYMDSRYNKNITLDDVANYLDINKSYFCTLLKKEVGKTFTQILNTIRIEKSKGFLLEGTSSILDIALAVGFNNQNYYNIAFKKITGMTPLEFKKIS